jgi:S1-C subfamily serine protease
MDPRDELVGPRGRQSFGPSVNGWLVMILVALVLVLLYRDFRRQSALHDPTAVERTVAARGDLAEDEKSTIELFKKISPSVVHVTSLVQGRDLATFNLMELPRGVGSGFVWDRKGYIVTNYHVTVEGNAWSVTLADNSTWKAERVGFDDTKDLAVLKIEAPPERLIPIPVGSSKDLQVGQKVFAIGSPFELDQTLTTGVIGGLGREIKSVTGRPIQGVIQTDAAINPGNSGGPLLDSAGRLIGVNTAIASPSGGSVGIGFAVPVDIVNRVIPQLVRTRKVERAGLGVIAVDDQITRRLGLEGVLVKQVVEDGAAAIAGMRSTSRGPNDEIIWGDLIVAINGQAIHDTNDLFVALDSLAVGDTIQVTVHRDGKELDISVTLQSVATGPP